MNAYVWMFTSPVSGNYHSGGSIVAIAKTIEEARVNIERELRRSDTYQHLTEQAILDATWKSDKPNFIWPVNELPMVLLFPDAGCC